MRALVLITALIACRGKHDADQIRVAPPEVKHHVPGRATISGHVLDAGANAPVGSVKVIFAAPAGELEAVSNVDGVYTLTLPVGAYHVFVRDERVMSIGLPDRDRTPDEAPPPIGGTYDATLAPTLVVTDADAADVDIEVQRIARLSGRVIDIDGKTVSDAIVRAAVPVHMVPLPTDDDDVRPVLSTDIATTTAAGDYELRLPEGRYQVSVSHPKYATSTARTVSVTHSSFPTKTTLELDPGCVISGRVMGPTGPSHDGEMERERPSIERFGAAGRIAADGTFRFTTFEQQPVTLRAWPWHMMPSETKVFACKPGARFTDVRFDVVDGKPDLAGTITDANGAPVPFVSLDVKPISPNANGQQERADAAGTWGVLDVRPGQYEITASAPRLGIVVAQVTSPAQNIHLVLNGTGRIAGTTTSLVDGAMVVSFTSCSDAFDLNKRPMQIAHDPRLVLVRGGRFVIDDVPACQLAFSVRWHGIQLSTGTDVLTGKTSTVELTLGTAREKVVSGTVRDLDNNPVQHAHVTTMRDGKEAASVYSDDDGHYSLKTIAGAELVAREGLRGAQTTVGRAAVAAETIDLTIVDQ